jgi:predicted Kef-type K+ transport protein
MKLVNSKERVDPSEAFAVLFAIIVGAIFWPISLVGVLLYIPVHYLTKKTNKGKR